MYMAGKYNIDSLKFLNFVNINLYKTFLISLIKTYFQIYLKNLITILYFNILSRTENSANISKYSIVCNIWFFILVY